MRRTPFKVLLLALGTGAFGWTQPSQGCDLSEEHVAKFAGVRYEDLRCILLPSGEGIYAASWTTRTRTDPVSHVSRVKTDRGSAHVLQQLQIPGAYGSALALWRGTPTSNIRLVVLSQVGAAAMDARVYAFGRTLRELKRIEGTAIEIRQMPDARLVLIAHHHVDAIDVPDLFCLRSGSVADCNARYPEFYKDLLASFGTSEVSQTLYPYLARLAHLSGDREAEMRFTAKQRKAR
jgi:hypothetical protein